MNLPRPLHWLTCLAFLLVSVVTGQAETVTLASIPERIRTSNPSLIAARLRIEEARARFQGAGRLANPSLGIELKHDRKFEEGTLTLSLDQSFPVTARLRLEKVLSHKAIAAAELEIRDAERKLIAEAQTAAVKLIYLARQRELRRQQAELSASLAQFATKRAQMGEISALDAAQAQVDSQRILLEVNQLEVERVSLTGELRMKLGSVSGTLTVGGGLPAPVSSPREISAGATTSAPKSRAMYGPILRPDYQKAKLAEQSARTEVEIAKAKKWEDVTAGVMLEGERSRDEPEGLERNIYMGFRLSIPLPLWNQNQGEIREKQAAVVRSVLETKALEVDIANEALLARNEMAANAQLANETQEKLMPLVIQQTDRLEQAYKRGEVDMLTVLRSRDQRLALESAILDATRNYHLARIRYDSATGKYSGMR
ncbi:MAG: TolC family protein [Candidatus Methylacidiphilales bacterium]|nr:TolC family protein [Candidatus Methylacidiphilales bacterium]